MKRTLSALVLAALSVPSFAGRVYITVTGSGTANGNGTCIAAPKKSGYGVTTIAEVDQTTPPYGIDQYQQQDWIGSQSGAFKIGVIWKQTVKGEKPPKSVVIRINVAHSHDAKATLAASNPTGNQVMAHAAGGLDALVSVNAGTVHKHYPKSGGTLNTPTKVTINFVEQPGGTAVAIASMPSINLQSFAGTNVDRGSSRLTGKGVSSLAVTASIVKYNY